MAFSALATFSINLSRAEAIEYWNNGSIRSVGGAKIDYDRDGKVKSVGDTGI